MAEGWVVYWCPTCERQTEGPQHVARQGAWDADHECVRIQLPPQLAQVALRLRTLEAAASQLLLGGLPGTRLRYHGDSYIGVLPKAYEGLQRTVLGDGPHDVDRLVDSAYPPSEQLRHLAAATAHLFDAHGCDHQGWEHWAEALRVHGRGQQ